MSLPRPRNDRGLQNVLGRGDNQPSVFHAFGGDQAVRHLLDLGRRTLHHDYLQAIVVIKVDMQSGEDFVMKFVLQVGQLFAE